MLVLAGSFIMVSLVLQVGAEGDGSGDSGLRVAAVRTGRFLYSSFLWPAFFVPLYLYGCSYVLVSTPFRKRHLILLTFSIVPFVTFSLLLKVIFGEQTYTSLLSSSLILLFGKAPAAILLGLAVLWELTFMWRLSDNRWSPMDAIASRLQPPVGVAEKRGEVQAERSPSEPVSLLLEGPRSLTAPEVDSDEGTERAAVSPNVHEQLTEEPPVDLLPQEESPEDEEVMDSSIEDHPAVSPRVGDYTVPVEGLLREYEDGEYWEIDDETRKSAGVLMTTLEEFGIQAEVTGIRKGPVITMFEILPALGVKVSKIVNLADNIALRLAASRVRIVAPIPGKHAVGIEVPNRKRAIVSFREIISLPTFAETRCEIPIVLGKDIAGEAQLVDLVQTPHLLIAGATGSGKSVCVNSIICSILYQKTPEQVRLLLVDPKIVELKLYNDIPHL